MRVSLGYVTVAALLAGAGVAATAAPVHAQEAARCACLLAPAAAGETIGQVSSVAGQVMVSQPAGFAGAIGGEGLSLGSRLMVGPGSQASVLFGSACSLTVPANQTLRVDAVEGGTCVSLEQAPPGQEAAADDPNLGTVMLGALGIGGVAGVAIALGSGDDDPASD